MKVVDGIYIYPVKGCRGIGLSECELHSRGLQNDRRWMIVDSKNCFVSQRSHPELAQIQVEVTSDGLDLCTPTSRITIQEPGQPLERLDVTVWGSVVSAVPAPQASEFISDFLSERMTLVYMDDRAVRLSKMGWEVSFADGFPLLITSVESLRELNRHTESEVTMERFRPNIVVSGGEAWQEDFWDQIQIGELAIDIISACARCKVTTLDQRSGSYMGKEPLKALSTHHLQGGKATFGVNAASAGSGKVSKGMEVSVLSTRDSSHLPLS